MTQVIEGEECNGRVSLFGQLSDEVRARNPGDRKTVVAVMDGEKALWDVFENNQDHMHYDLYFAAGYPIGSGVASPRQRA